jgi:membrane associated rhomboid family serine protease
MGLADRSYNPPISFGRVTPGVKWLLIANIGVFILHFFLARAGLAGLLAPFGLSPREVLTGFAFWQPVTYLFIHSAQSFSHILFNMLSLYMFGAPLEQTWGTNKFLRYYFACGVGAGLLCVVLNLLFGSADTRTIGASGAVYGLLLAFGMIFPDAMILFAFLFPMKAKYFVAIIGAIVFLSSIGDTGGNVSHFAHLGGMLAGFIYLRSGLMHKRSPGPGLFASMERAYKDWKLQRAKKKFQVYLRKQDSDRDRWIN